MSMQSDQWRGAITVVSALALSLRIGSACTFRFGLLAGSLTDVTPA